MSSPIRNCLKLLAADALRHADGEQAVLRYLAQEPITGSVRVLALGKAAAAMWRGAAASLSSQVRAALVITNVAAGSTDFVAGAVRPQWQMAAHPVPDERSLAAGAAAMAFVQTTPVDETLLVLLSGGASALCEVLAEGVTLPALRALQQTLLAANIPIADLNAIRQSLSSIKAGGLARCCPAGAAIRQLIISDVPDDNVRVVGSAPFITQPVGPLNLTALPEFWQQWCRQHLIVSAGWVGSERELTGAASNPELALVSNRVQTAVIASNRSVRAALQAHAGQKNWPVIANETYADECTAVVTRIADRVRNGPSGLYLFGGECHLQLPAEPGRGGRNQQLALALSLALQDCPGIDMLSLATDGVDGDSDAAGAVFRSIDGLQTERQRSAAQAALATASSYDYWQGRGGLLFTGATGSNVADLLLCWKSSLPSQTLL